MTGLSLLGMFHTLISLAAVTAGFVALLRHGGISQSTRTGAAYLALTVVTCLTSLGLFAHGVFGNLHTLAVFTLFVIALTAWLETGDLLGSLTKYVVAVSYSFTLFLLLIPAVTETFTRLPLGVPLFATAEDPALRALTEALFGVFLVGAVLQVGGLRRSSKTSRATAGHRLD